MARDRRWRVVTGAWALALAAACGPAVAQSPDAGQTYEERLLRLSEILGAIHHLRDICGANEGSLWRDQMLALLEAEDPPGQLRGRLIGAFNEAYRGFQRTYSSCTTSAKTAADRFLTEGSEIATTLTLTLAAPPDEGAGEAGNDGAEAGVEVTN